MVARLFTGKGRWVLAAVCLIFIAALALSFFSSPPAQSHAVLDDGTTLELLRVTYGKNHELDLRPWRQRMLSRLAARFPRLFPGRLVRSAYVPKISSSNESLTVWFRRTRLSFTNSQSHEVYLLDKAGTGCRHSDQSSSYSLSATQDIAGYMFKTFPRRGEDLLLQFAQWDRNYSSKLPIAEFPLEAPRIQPPTPWNPEPLPATKRDGDLEFSLTRLQTGVSFRGGGPHQRATNLLDSATLAAFRVQQKGVTLTNWEPRKVLMSDASGNLSENTSWSNRSSSDEQEILFQWGLWPTEPAWKLRVEFSRLGAFTSNEQWQTSVPATYLVPASNYEDWKKSNALASITISGTQIRIMCLHEKRGYDGTSLRAGANASQPFTLEVMTVPDKGDYRLTLLKVTDETGRELKRNGTSWGGGDYHFDFEDLGKAKSLNVTLAYHQSRFAEFIAAPTPFTEEKKNADAR